MFFHLKKSTNICQFCDFWIPGQIIQTLHILKNQLVLSYQLLSNYLARYQHGVYCFDGSEE